MQMASSTPPFGYPCQTEGISPAEITMPLIYGAWCPFSCLHWVVRFSASCYPDLIMWLPRAVF